MFLAGAVASLAVVAAGIVTGLTPGPNIVGQPNDVAVAGVSTLRERVPELVVVPELKGLDAKARSLRMLGVYTPTSDRAPRTGDLPVFVVRSDDTVHAFIGVDPRNACRLELLLLRDRGIAFHDVCHGSLYDLGGQRIGGPSPWSLDELVISVRGGIVYADRRKVTPGRLTLG